MFSCQVKNNLLATFPSIPPHFPLLLFCRNYPYNPHPLLPTSVHAIFLFFSFIIIISITPFFFVLLLFTFLLPLTKVVVIAIELLQILHGAIIEDAELSLCLKVLHDTLRFEVVAVLLYIPIVDQHVHVWIILPPRLQILPTGTVAVLGVCGALDIKIRCQGEAVLQFAEELLLTICEGKFIVHPVHSTQIII